MKSHLESQIELPFSEPILLRGRLRLEVFRKGDLVDVIEGENVVISGGKVHILRLMGAISGFTAISRMAAADGGCGVNPAISALFTPIAFAATDVNLRGTATHIHVTNQVIVPATDLDIGAKTLKFIATFDSALTTSANFHFTPRVINEFALKSGASDNAVLALRATRSVPFDPADAVSVRATWTIGLT